MKARSSWLLTIGFVFGAGLAACNEGGDDCTPGTEFCACQQGTCIAGLTCSGGTCFDFGVADEADDADGDSDESGSGSTSTDTDADGSTSTSTSTDTDADAETSTTDSSTDVDESTDTDPDADASTESSTTGSPDGGTCGWYADGNYYECGYIGEDPDGIYPIECPPGLVVGADCSDRSLFYEGCCDENGDLWFCSNFYMVSYVDCVE